MTKRRGTLFEQLKAGLEEGIRFAQGELTLRTTERVAKPPVLTPEQIANTREMAGMSQAILADTLGVSVRTVQSWEQGVRQPSQLARRFLQVMSARPKVVCDVIGLRRNKRGRNSKRKPRQSTTR
jgi:putative transcriptional regulator